MARPYKGWSVFWRADKRRWILARDGRQTLLPKELRNRREAVKHATQWLVEQGYLEDDGTAKRREKTDTVGDLADQWVRWRRSMIGKGWEPATVSNNQSHVKRQIKPVLGSTPIGDVSPRVVAAFIQGLTCAPNTKRNVYRTLLAMFDDCIEQGWCALEINPCKGTVAQKAVPEAMTAAQEVEAETRLSLEDCRALTSDPRVRLERRVKYLCALTLVARDGEVMGLSWGAIDFERGAVRIYQTAKIRRYAEDPDTGKPKTKKSRRTNPLHPATASALMEWRAEQATAHGSEPLPEHPVFPGRSRSEFTRTHAARLFRDDLTRVGIRDRVAGIPLQFHHLRHTALNLLREAGVDQAVRDQLAGHAPRSVGEGSYQHRTIEQLAVEIRKLPLEWAGVQGSYCASSCAQVTETGSEVES